MQKKILGRRRHERAGRWRSASRGRDDGVGHDRGGRGGARGRLGPAFGHAVRRVPIAGSGGRGQLDIEAAGMVQTVLLEEAVQRHARHR